MSTKIVLASSNAGKIAEFQSATAGLGISLVPQTALGIEDAEETGTTFIENAIIKARHAASLSGLPSIADDSGLMVDALNGDPGIFSSRYAADTQARIDKLLSALEHINDKPRSARFYCLTVFMRDALDPAPLIFEGKWEGEILKQPLGDKGFGYDPVFYVPEYDCSAAQLESAVKNTISHRGQVLKQLRELFIEQVNYE